MRLSRTAAGSADLHLRPSQALALTVKAMKQHHGLALPSLLPHMRALHINLDALGLCKGALDRARVFYTCRHCAEP